MGQIDIGNILVEPGLFRAFESQFTVSFGCNTKTGFHFFGFGGTNSKDKAHHSRDNECCQKKAR